MRKCIETAEHTCAAPHPQMGLVGGIAVVVGILMIVGVLGVAAYYGARNQYGPTKGRIDG
jgi:hypothetical protein